MRITKALCVIWILYGIGLVSMIATWRWEELMHHSTLCWAGVVDGLVLTISGYLVAVKKNVAKFGLLLGVLGVMIWAGDICLFFLWRGRYPILFWVLFGSVLVGAITIVWILASKRSTAQNSELR